MQCPYCLGEVEDEALVCRICTRDLYLFKPMMAKIATLEAQVQALPDAEAYEARIRLLEQQLESVLAPVRPETKHGLGASLIALAAFILLPLCLLLVAHWLITVVYDTQLIYLRIISIVLPLPFGFFLFGRHKRAVWPWFAGTCILAIAAVIGMSWITSLVDQTPVLPRNAFEWREFLEYAASISFSFLTGMLLGGMRYARQYRPQVRPLGPVGKAVGAGLQEKKSAPEQLSDIIKKLTDYGSTAVALGTTALSMYTGLKDFMGQ